MHPHPGERSWQPQHENGIRSVAVTRKTSKPIFILASLLLGVLMSVSNIRNAIQKLPGTNDDYIRAHFDEGIPEKRPSSLNFAQNTTSIADAITLDVVTPALSTPLSSSKSLLSEMPSLNFAQNSTSIADAVTLDVATSALSTPLSSSKSLLSGIPSLNFAQNSTSIADAVTLDVATPTLSTPLSSSKSLLSEMPNNKNTVISLVSMGRLVNTYLVERCIRSIRRRGLFSGNILVFTDAIGYERYQKSVLPWDNRTKIILGRDEDMNPRDPVTETPKKYLQETLIFKRFKTHHSKYIAEDADLADSIRYVMYVDVDNMIGVPLSEFFRAYANGVASEYQRASDEHQTWKQNSTAALGKVGNETTAEEDTDRYGFGFVSMFRDKHLKGKMHSGVIVYDRKFEERCVNGWRNEMDTFWHASDQTMFLRVLDNYDRYRCTAFALPPEYMSFATKRLMVSAMEARQKTRKSRKQLNLPTFVHVTDYRVRRVKNATIHDDFVRYVLDLKDNENITDAISWEDAVPSDAKRTGKGR